jgi:hypothetical protein
VEPEHDLRSGNRSVALVRPGVGPQVIGPHSGCFVRRDRYVGIDVVHEVARAWRRLPVGMHPGPGVRAHVERPRLDDVGVRIAAGEGHQPACLAVECRDKPDRAGLVDRARPFGRRPGWTGGHWADGNRHPWRACPEGVSAEPWATAQRPTWRSKRQWTPPEAWLWRSADRARPPTQVLCRLSVRRARCRRARSGRRLARQVGRSIDFRHRAPSPEIPPWDRCARLSRGVRREAAPSARYGSSTSPREDGPDQARRARATTTPTTTATRIVTPTRTALLRVSARCQKR